jgi:succinate dehydrogenase / fumarate reductase cytochrome b subunit
MSWLTRFLGSNIGLKIVMALSGFVLFGFTVGHMGGNLQVFLGPDVFNAYAASLQGNAPLLWGVRLTLLAAVSAHIYSAVALTLRSKAARPQGYKERKFLSGSYAARTMKFGGIVLLAFIVYHLLHLTVGAAHPSFEHCHLENGHLACSAYHNLTVGLSNPLVAGFYMLAQVFLGMHLAHGVWSLARTLGLSNPRYDALARKAAWTFGGLVSGGNIVIALACLLGIVG